MHKIRYCSYTRPLGLIEMKKTLFIITISILLTSCRIVNDYFYGRNLHKTNNYNEKKTSSLLIDIKNQSDTILYFRCSDYKLCDSSIYNISYYIYTLDNSINVKKITHPRKDKILISQPYDFELAKQLFQFVKSNKIDTVTTEPKRELYCDHCGGTELVYTIGNDTLINNYLYHYQLVGNDSNHILNKFSYKIIDKLIQFEKNN